MEPTRCGPYLIRRQLGAGGMGVVYEAVGEDGARVALKVVHPHILERGDDARARFEREIDVGRRIVHPNVVRTLGSGAEGGRPYVVLEFVAGHTLEELARELGQVPEDLCRHVGREIASGLAAVHAEGIVHRDVKPGNVLITPDHVVKLMDLGLARGVAGEDRLSESGMFVGTWAYAAPEQFRGTKEVDPRADLYATGALLYDLATGRPPFDAKSGHQLLKQVLNDQPPRPGQLNPQLSPFFEELLLALLAKRPDDRLESAAELVDVLAAGEGGPWWSSQVTTLLEVTRRPLRKIRIPRETECVGREPELAALRAGFDDVKAGNGRVVLLCGEAGIGKSRLIDELMRRLEMDGEDVNFLVGSYPPGGASTSTSAFTAAYREQFGNAGCSAYLTETPALVPSFDAFLRGDATPIGAEPLVLDSLKAVFVNATRALGRERPTVVVIDDLHFAPEEGRALFASLAAAVAGHRVLLLGTMRPGIPREWQADVERLDHVVHRDVQRLGTDDIRRVLRPIVGSSPRAERLAESVAETADGNPFFVFEIVRTLRERGVVTQRADGEWDTDSEFGQIELPETLNTLLAARIERLAQQERELLECAVCCGYEFDGGLVAEALGVPRLPALRAFGRLEQMHGMVRARGVRFVFDHHAILEHVRASLPEALRVELHAALGDVIENRIDGRTVDPGDLDGDDCVELCSHFLRGGRGQSAARYLAAALGHLARQYAHDRALELIDRALDVPGLLAGGVRVELLLGKCESLRARGSVDQRRSVLDEATGLLATTGDRVLEVRVGIARAELLRSAGDRSGALRVVEQALEIASSAGAARPEAEAHFLAAGLQLQLDGVDPSVPGRHYEQCIELARQVGDLAMESRATTALGMARLSMNDEAAARAHLERGLQFARDAGDLGAEFDALDQLAAERFFRGRNDVGALNGRVLELARRMGDRPREARALSFAATVADAAGDLEEARVLLERCALLWREIGDSAGEVSAAWRLLSYCREPRDTAWALPWAERRARLVSAGSFPNQRRDAVRDFERLLSSHGEFETKLHEYERLHADKSDRPERRDELVDVTALALLHHHVGRLERALELARMRVRLAGECGPPILEIESLISLASILRTLGRREEARDTLGTALGLARSKLDRSITALTHAALADLLVDEGDVDAAFEALAEPLEGKGADAARASLAACWVLMLAGCSSDARAEADVRTAPARLTPSHRVVAQAWLAWLPEEEGTGAQPDETPTTCDEAREAALELFRDAGRLSVPAQMEARLLLWKATGEDAHLTAAHGLLQHLIANAPADCRAAMPTATFLHREIVTAFGERNAD